jgi:hypothetical protein
VTEFEKLQLRENAIGVTTREEMINNGRRQFNDLFANDPSYNANLQIINKGLVNLRIDNRKLHNNTTPVMNAYQMLDEEITMRLGDVLSYEDGYWICIEAYDFHSIHRNFLLEECNYTLYFQDLDTLEIHERKCSIRNPYSSGISESRVVSVEASKYRLKMPYDEQSRKFKVGRRFLIALQGENQEPMPYSIIEFDPVTAYYNTRQTTEGFLILNLISSQIVPDDNKLLMIANYREPGAPLPPRIGSVEITYTGDLLLRQNSQTFRNFTAVFTDSEGQPITSIVPNWTIEPVDLVSSGRIVYQLSDDGYTIGLRATQQAIVGTEILVKVTSDNALYGFFEASLVLRVRTLF